MKKLEYEITRLKNNKGIALSVALMAGFGVVYALWRVSRGKTSHQLDPKQIGVEKLNLSHNGDVQLALLFGKGKIEVLAVRKKLGAITRDSAREQWRSEDQAVSPHLERINQEAGELNSRPNFSLILKGNFSEILATEWKSSETLEVILKPGVDTVAFSKLLKEKVDHLIGFSKLLDLVVKRIDNPYFIIVRLNTKPGLSPIGES